MKLTRRDCPVKIVLTPCRPYYIEVDFEIGGDQHQFTPDISEHFFSRLMGAIFALYFEGHDSHRVPQARSYHTPVSGGHEALISSEVSWSKNEDQEKITFSRVSSDWPGVPPKKRADPITVTVSYKCLDDKSDMFTYIVDGRELCYAVGKAATDAIKKFGFHGYSHSTSDSNTEADLIDMNQLVFLKAYALRAMEARTLKENGWGFSSTLAEELELILFEM